MKRSSLFQRVFVGVCAVTIGVIPAGAGIVTNAFKDDSNELAYTNDISTVDLLHGLTGDSETTPWTYNVNALNDGVHTTATYPMSVPALNSYVVYDLGLGDNGSGYDVTNIVSFAAGASHARNLQGHTVEVQLVGSTSFELLATVIPWTTGWAGATKVELTHTSGRLARGVQKIKFKYVGHGVFLNESFLREFDVFGTSSPARGTVISIH